ncbi:unnamed protein product [Cunninghamella blakesleeana]
MSAYGEISTFAIFLVILKYWTKRITDNELRRQFIRFKNESYSIINEQTNQIHEVTNRDIQRVNDIDYLKKKIKSLEIESTQTQSALEISYKTISEQSDEIEKLNQKISDIVMIRSQNRYGRHRC